MVIKEIFLNQYFLIGFVAWLIAQVSKVILTLLIDKKLNLYRLVGSGGMPSSHTSFVMGLTTALGLDFGWDSAIFALSLVFSLVVMYDASGVRRAVGKQAIILNTMLDDLYKHRHIGQEKLKELIGHTSYEVLIGAILGIFIANIMM
ncbi:MAG: divergent PAP2 family protein [Clostridiales bacterium]|nr:divergent PAP2 family protein [Clostridiales bacterium]